MTDHDDILASLRGHGAGSLFVFAGPSGAGKSTVCRALLEYLPGVSFSVSHTTRAPRNDEAEGLHYFFVNEEEFERMVRGGEFAEYATVHGHRYGTSRREIEVKLAGDDLLLDIDVQGAAQIRTLYPDAILVFIFPPSLNELRARLEGRKQNDADDIDRRVEVAKAEIEAARDFDYFIINDCLSTAVATAESIIKAERQRISKRLGAP